ncbi:MAG: FKBP-type peptidyl-prolyl cis-trans isomerase [Bacteroidales bacterium]|nr:FKBP-type peptidyl-prolyl cis-trans isomerase [Bacteroidales bacterium]
MKRINGTLHIAVCIALAVTAAASCAKTESVDTHKIEKEYFDSWMKIHYPDCRQQTALGSYIISDTEGNGQLIGDENATPYVYGEYTQYDLDGTITYYCDAQTAKQLGLYDSTLYYGPKVIFRSSSSLNAGLSELFSTMKEGGRRKAVVPGWLNTTERYSSAEEYAGKVSGTPKIYDLRPQKIITDIVKWEVDSTASYVARKFPQTDSTQYGFYYHQEVEPSDTASFAADDRVYLNYVARLLNGRVFDTNVKDSAKYYGIYNPSASYGKVYVTWADSHTDMKMGTSSSSVISGFSLAVSRMKKGERGTAIFYSAYGYGSTGSGDAIPPYSPLIFNIELIGKEE